MSRYSRSCFPWLPKCIKVTAEPDVFFDSDPDSIAAPAGECDGLGNPLSFTEEDGLGHQFQCIVTLDSLSNDGAGEDLWLYVDDRDAPVPAGLAQRLREVAYECLTIAEKLDGI